MIDYTNIQLNTVHPKITPFQKTNIGEKSGDDTFRAVLVMIALGTAIIIGFNIYKNMQKDEECDIISV